MADGGWSRRAEAAESKVPSSVLIRLLRLEYSLPQFHLQKSYPRYTCAILYIVKKKKREHNNSTDDTQSRDLLGQQNLVMIKDYNYDRARH